ncbi:transposable element Tcb1 transposase [Trichonephila clavipes]|nr:transposable element Tcb1 transposase [Trichonephila clavipes]
MTAQWYVHDILQLHMLPLIQQLPVAIWSSLAKIGACAMKPYIHSPRNHFSTRQCLDSRGKGATRLSPHCYYPSLACPIPRFVSNQAYLRSFGTAGWASHEFELIRGKVTANM